MAQHAHPGLEQGGLAHAVAAQQRHHLSRAHIEVDVANGQAAAVAGAEPAAAKQLARVRRLDRTRRARRRRLSGNARPQVGFAHRRVHGHLGWGTFGDHLAHVQDGDAFGQGQHAVDVVLDQQHGARAGDAPDDPADPLAVRLGQAGQRLVQQQQRRIAGQGHGDVQQALLAVRQILAAPRSAFHQADRRQQLPHPRVTPRVPVGIPEHRGRAAVGRLHRQAQVLEHAQAVEYRDDLEGATQAQARAPMRRNADQFTAPQTDASGIRLQQPGQQVEQGGLARSVGTDHAVHAARGDAQVDGVLGHDGAETLAQSPNLEHGRVRPRLGQLRRARRVFLDSGRHRRHLLARQRASAAPAQATKQPVDSARIDKGQHDDDGREVQPPVLAPGAELVLQDDEGDGPPQGAEEMLHAAQRHHQHRVAGLLPAQRIGVGAAQQQGHAGSRHADGGSGDGEGPQLDLEHVDAQAARTPLVVAHRLHAAPEGGVGDAPQQQAGQHHDPDDQRGETPGGLELGPVGDLQAVLASGEIGPAVGDLEGQLRTGQGQ